MPYYRAEKIYYEEMDDRRSHGRDMMCSPHHHRHSYHPENERYRRDGYPEYYSEYDDGHRRSAHSHHHRSHSSRQEITPSPRARELMPVPNHYPDEKRYEKPQQMISLEDAKDLVVTAVKELNATPTAPKPQRVVSEEDYQLLQQLRSDQASSSSTDENWRIYPKRNADGRFKKASKKDEDADISGFEELFDADELAMDYLYNSDDDEESEKGGEPPYETGPVNLLKPKGRPPKQSIKVTKDITKGFTAIWEQTYPLYDAKNPYAPHARGAFVCTINLSVESDTIQYDDFKIYRDCQWIYRSKKKRWTPYITDKNCWRHCRCVSGKRHYIVANKDDVFVPPDYLTADLEI